MPRRQFNVEKLHDLKVHMDALAESRRRYYEGYARPRFNRALDRTWFHMREKQKWSNRDIGEAISQLAERFARQRMSNRGHFGQSH